MPRKGKVVILLVDEDDPLPTAEEQAELESLFGHILKAFRQGKKAPRRPKKSRNVRSKPEARPNANQ